MSQEYHIYKMLEPTLVLGNHKRYNRETPVWMEKNRELERLIKELGADEYRRRCQEDAERERQNYMY